MRYLRIKDYAWIKSMRDKNVELRMIYGGDNLIARVDICVSKCVITSD